MQNSGPWDPWLPVVENSRLFAQRSHSARCAPLVHCVLECVVWLPQGDPYTTFGRLEILYHITFGAMTCRQMDSISVWKGSPNG